MIMAVVPNSNSRSNGVFAADPMHQTDVLCQKDIVQSVQPSLTKKCEDGLIHKNTCVFAKFGRFNYYQGQAYCKSKGGYLAYIDSSTKYYAVDNYLRTKAQSTFGSYNFKDFWWGARFQNREVVLNNGERPTWVKWQPPHPLHEPQRTAMIMAVVPNSNRRANGVMAADPMHQTDVLCQKDIWRENFTKRKNIFVLSFQLTICIHSHIIVIAWLMLICYEVYNTNMAIEIK